MSTEFLSELQWEDGFAIPVANQENKMLEDQVRRTGWELGNGRTRERQLRNGRQTGCAPPGQPVEDRW